METFTKVVHFLFFLFNNLHLFGFRVLQNPLQSVEFLFRMEALSVSYKRFFSRMSFFFLVSQLILMPLSLSIWSLSAVFCGNRFWFCSSALFSSVCCWIKWLFRNTRSPSSQKLVTSLHHNTGSWSAPQQWGTCFHNQGWITNPSKLAIAQDRRPPGALKVILYSHDA